MQLPSKARPFQNPTHAEAMYSKQRSNKWDISANNGRYTTFEISNSVFDTFVDLIGQEDPFDFNAPRFGENTLSLLKINF